MKAQVTDLGFRCAVVRRERVNRMAVLRIDTSVLNGVEAVVEGGGTQAKFQVEASAIVDR